jgi:hypothetical protein
MQKVFSLSRTVTHPEDVVAGVPPLGVHDKQVVDQVLGIV